MYFIFTQCVKYVLILLIFIRIPTHFVMVFDTNFADTAGHRESRGSVHSIRRGSNEVRSVASDFLRRSSLAKLNALPLEAPITKVISTIRNLHVIVNLKRFNNRTEKYFQ